MPIIEDLANPAMRTRHWKQLVRISGGTALIYNDTIKTLTFGQLLDLDLQSIAVYLFLLCVYQFKLRTIVIGTGFCLSSMIFKFVEPHRHKSLAQTLMNFQLLDFASILQSIGTSKNHLLVYKKTVGNTQKIISGFI